ncbi:hypothetical protein GGR32_000165 [Mesonia hippocampi]|uniref:Uncharacterized protein n=1 Tax=Mesonia hippocampi TaxID=1628250 RepID=A0A840EMN0_9FLAO|nr:hypothetical protein [Mesonia hippocampi]MBB4117893.1 hypothetical protein [Mesonia hippocampi]
MKTTEKRTVTELEILTRMVKDKFPNAKLKSKKTEVATEVKLNVSETVPVHVLIMFIGSGLVNQKQSGDSICYEFIVDAKYPKESIEGGCIAIAEQMKTGNFNFSMESAKTKNKISLHVDGKFDDLSSGFAICFLNEPRLRNMILSGVAESITVKNIIINTLNE